MAIELKPEQVKQLKEQLAEANRNSHFVIISAISKKSIAASTWLPIGIII